MGSKSNCLTSRSLPPEKERVFGGKALANQEMSFFKKVNTMLHIFIISFNNGHYLPFFRNLIFHSSRIYSAVHKHTDSVREFHLNTCIFTYFLSLVSLDMIDLEHCFLYQWKAYCLYFLNI